MFIDVKITKEIEVLNDRYCGENCPQCYEKYNECYLLGRLDMIELDHEIVFDHDGHRYACAIRHEDCRKLTGVIVDDGLPAYIERLETYENDREVRRINQKAKEELEETMNRINAEPIDYDGDNNDEEFK